MKQETLTELETLTNLTILFTKARARDSYKARDYNKAI